MVKHSKKSFTMYAWLSKNCINGKYTYFDCIFPCNINNSITTIKQNISDSLNVSVLMDRFFFEKVLQILRYMARLS